MDQSLLEEQSKIYRVEGVDEGESVAPKKKRKQHVNGEEVSRNNTFDLWQRSHGRAGSPSSETQESSSQHCRLCHVNPARRGH